jgi:CspA family cold shock protein
MAKGTIKTLTGRGFGFIQSESGEELFFHSNDLVGVEFNSLKQGQEVEFEMGQGRDGRPQAVRVSLIETQPEDNGGDSGG